MVSSASVAAWTWVLLVASAALNTPAHAQDFECGRPLPSPARYNQPHRTARAANPQNQPPTEGLHSRHPKPVQYANCGAVPISDRFILTAAFCVLDPNNPVSAVTLGDLDLSVDDEPNSRPVTYDIEAIILHPDFTMKPGSRVRYHDLALLKTVKKIEFNDVVFPFCLSSRAPAPGTTVTVSGFGQVNATHTSAHLMEGELQILSLSHCENQYRSQGKEALLSEAYPNLLRQGKVICAGHPGRGPCKGDEGGPVFHEDTQGRKFLDGVISFTGDTCDENILPSVATSVADHIGFIRHTLKSV